MTDQKIGPSQSNIPEQKPLLTLRMPQKGTLVKGGGGLTAMGLIFLITKIAIFEPQIAPKATAGVQENKTEIALLRAQIKEKTRGIATNGNMKALEDKQILLARDLDSKASIKEILLMELRILGKIEEQSRKNYEDVKELFRLFALKQNGNYNRNGRAE